MSVSQDFPENADSSLPLGSFVRNNRFFTLRVGFKRIYMYKTHLLGSPCRNPSAGEIFAGLDYVRCGNVSEFLQHLTTGFMTEPAACNLGRDDGLL